MPYGQTAEYGAGGPGRDRITQALMDVQNPAPTADVPPLSPAPPGGAMGAMPGGGAGAPGGGAKPPAATGTPGIGTPPMLPQLGAAVPPGMQPGGMLAPPMSGGMPPRY